MSTTPDASVRGPVKLAVGVFAVCAAVAAVYAQVYAFEFVSFDDPDYVLDNPVVSKGLSWEAFSWAWSSVYFCWWHPITWLSHMADVELFGLWAGGHHLTSVVLHVLGTAALGVLASRLGLPPLAAVWVTAMVMLHPTRVESVAWVSERKDVLCFLFGALAALGWFEFRRAQGLAWYLLLVWAYLMCIASKSTLVTLPFVFLLCESWREGGPARVAWRRRLVELSPVFAMSFAAATLTLFGQREEGAVISTEALSLPVRLNMVPAAYVEYVVKTVYPVDLYYFYPREPLGPLVTYGSMAAFFVVTAALFLFRRSTWHLLHGWLAFVLMLGPVIGVVAVGGAFVADRYLSVPHVPLFLGVALTLTPLASRVSPLVSVGVGVTLVAWLTSLTYLQTSTWRDSETLYRHALDIRPDNPFVMLALGKHLNAEQRVDEALPYLLEAKRWNPEALAHLSFVFLKKGDRDRALRNARQAVAQAPDSKTVRMLVGRVLTQVGVNEGRAGRPVSAIAFFEESIRVDPSNQHTLAMLRVATDDLQAHVRPAGLDGGVVTP